MDKTRPGNVVTAILVALLTSGGAAPAFADSIRCESGQTAALGKYHACRAKAEGAFVLDADTDARDAERQECVDDLFVAWGRLHERAANADTFCHARSDVFLLHEGVNSCQAVVALGLSGAAIPDLAECESDLTACILDRNACTPVLSDVEDYADACQADNVSCSLELDACEDDVAACDGTPDGSGPLRTGQTSYYGPGTDGDLQLGTPRSFTDNGDGTITDNVTGLMWEKKDESGGIHDKDNRYAWCDTGGDPGCDSNDMAGPIVAVFLAALNSGAGFAGHTDWRIPNINELATLRRTRRVPGWATHVEFENGCTPGCTATECSCTEWTEYWSSSTHAADPSAAWVMKVGDGMTYGFPKFFSHYARAVRGGL